MLKRTTYIVVAIVVLGGALLYFVKNNEQNDSIQVKDKILQKEINNDKEEIQIEIKNISPLTQYESRITKKPFGIFITPQTSPVQREKFYGYHTGTDFEIFDTEFDTNVIVRAICDGEIIQKKYVSGYGGTLIQKCLLDNKAVTVLYGHLNINTINYKQGDKIKKDDKIGLLGNDKSVQTDYERKHLHIGIHKGQDIDLRGYVSDKSKLNMWLDSCKFIDCLN